MNLVKMFYQSFSPCFGQGLTSSASTSESSKSLAALPLPVRKASGFRSLPEPVAAMPLRRSLPRY